MGKKKFKELKISASPNGNYSVTIDGEVKISGVPWKKVVAAVKKFEEEMDEQVQREV